MHIYRLELETSCGPATRWSIEPTLGPLDKRKVVKATFYTGADALRALAAKLDDTMDAIAHDAPYAHDGGISDALRALADSE